MTIGKIICGNGVDWRNERGTVAEMEGGEMIEKIDIFLRIVIDVLAGIGLRTVVTSIKNFFD